MKVVNLSRRRFVNVRPVTRATVVLWVLGAVLTATNLFLFLQYWIDSVEIRSQGEQTLDLIDQQRDAILDIQRRFEALDLPVQNRRVEFLNTLIGARTFPWSQLFDDLEEVLIADARVVSVQPRIEIEKEQATRRPPVPTRSSRSRRGRSRAEAADEREEAVAKPAAEPEHREVQLSLRGFVKDDQALADLVDAFFDDPSFRSPYLAGESTDPSSGGLSFNLDVTYLLPVKPTKDLLPDESVAAGAPAAAGTGPQTAAAGEAGSPEEPDVSAATAVREVPESSEEGVGESPRSEPDSESEDEAAASPSRPSARLPSRQRPPVVPPSPVAGSPAAGSPVAGSPAAGSPAAVVRAPPARSPASPPRPRGVPLSPASPLRPAAPDSPRTPPPPPVRPKFVGPEATGTPRITHRGGTP